MSGSTGRWRRWVLPVSLAVNVFLLTVIAVHEWRRPHGPPNPRRMVEDIASSLPEADATVLRQTFAAEPELQQDPFKGGADTMASLRKVLRTEPFDPVAFAAEFHKLHERRDRFEQALDRALQTAVATMSPEGRRRLADHRGPPGPPPND